MGWEECRREEDRSRMKEGEESGYREIFERVLERVSPSSSEREKLLNFARVLVVRLRKKLHRSGIRADVQIQGSIAKDTWLAGEKDIDAFIILPKKYPDEFLQSLLEVVKDFVGEDWSEAYSEHPYIEAMVGGYKIDLVPCFKVGVGGEQESAVDRTPLHTQYIRKRLRAEERKEVRLLKQFMHGIGVYGAEIRVRGFSGYLCELLTLKYSTLLRTLKAASKWKKGKIIDLEKAYEGRLEEAGQLFEAPLIVIDPVDSKRNVAAAVSTKSLGEFVSASRSFLKNPRIALFLPPPPRPPRKQRLKDALSRLGYDLLALTFSSSDIPPDILWGQLYKSLRSVRSLLTRQGFRVLKTLAWSDEKKENALFIALESRIIPSAKRHLGPPYDSQEAGSFLEKHLNSEDTVLGPWIDGGRWVVVVKRSYTDAVKLLQEKLSKHGARTGVASMLIDSFKTSLRIRVNQEIILSTSHNKDFATTLRSFILGRPRWMNQHPINASGDSDKQIFQP